MIQISGGKSALWWEQKRQMSGGKSDKLGGGKSDKGKWYIAICEGVTEGRRQRQLCVLRKLPMPLTCLFSSVRFNMCPQRKHSHTDCICLILGFWGRSCPHYWAAKTHTFLNNPSGHSTQYFRAMRGFWLGEWLCDKLQWDCEKREEWQISGQTLVKCWNVQVCKCITA